jgi:hypothetical protein
VTVTRFRQLLPAGNLDRTRPAAMIIGCLGLAANLAQIGNEQRSPRWHLASFLAILLVMVTVVLTHLRDRAPWWD